MGIQSRSKPLQMSIFDVPGAADARFENCPHGCCFTTLACVPCGVYCTGCSTLLWQYLPESPEKLGYLSAEWAWHYRDGKAWTTLPRASEGCRANA